MTDYISCYNEKKELERYRIKKVTKGDGTVWYCPQKKVLWVWWNMVECPNPYGNKCWANAVIRSDFKDSQKDKVEYIKPDTSQTVPPEPNPPPKVL